MDRSNQHSLDVPLSTSMATAGDTDMCTREESLQPSATEQEQPQHQQRCRRPYRHQQNQHHPSTLFLGCTTQDEHRAGSQLTEMLSSVPRSCSMRALFDAPSNLEPKACTRCDAGNDDGSDGNDDPALEFDDEDKQESPPQPLSFSVETARINDITSSLSTSELNLEPPPSAPRCAMGAAHFDTNIASSSPFPAPRPMNSHSPPDYTHSIDASARQLEHPHITYPGKIWRQDQADSASTTPSELPVETRTARTPTTNIIFSVDHKYTCNADLNPASKKMCTAPEMNQQASGYSARPHSYNGSRVHKDLDQDSDSDYNSSSSNSSSNRSSRSSSISGDTEHKGSERMKGCQYVNPDTKLTSSAAITDKPVSMKRRKMSEDEEHDVNSAPEVVSGSQASHLALCHRSMQSPLSTKSSSVPASSPCRKRRSVQSEPPSKIPTGSEALGTACLDTSSLSLLSATSAVVSEGSISTVVSDTKGGQPILPSQSTPSPMPLPPIAELRTFRPLDPLEESTCAIVRSTGRPLSYQHCRRSAPLLVGPCRKRSFEDAIELTRPLGNDPSIEHIGWFGSIKRRKIHHYPTRWTSSLSPTPYVKLMAIRDFWDVMMSRLDLSWLNLWTVRAAAWQGCSQERYLDTMMTTDADDCTRETTGPASLLDAAQKANQDRQDGTKAELITHGFGWAVCLKTRRRTVIQYPSTGMSLRGLWEEEETIRRRRQMIPDGVHKPPRSKILNRKPIPRLNPHSAQTSARANSRLRSTSFPRLSNPEEESPRPQGGSQPPSTEKTDQGAADMEALSKKKHGPAPATVRSQALSDGYDLNEYRPWRDGTVMPHQGSFHSLRQLRRTMLAPWPAEESRARDECTRILHRMREQLNVVINLQIHLRSMIKTVPAHMSFLLSIRHPGQVSIELLNALYGPQFMQSSAFRTIEQLLWGRKQPQRIEYHQQPQHQHLQNSSHSISHQYQDFQYHSHPHNGLADSTEPRNPERSYHHYQQAQGDLMEDDECAFEEAFDEPAYQDPMLGLDHTVGEDSKIFGSDHICDRKLHGHSSLQKAFYAPQDSEDEDIEELGVLSPRMDVVSRGQNFD